MIKYDKLERFSNYLLYIIFNKKPRIIFLLLLYMSDDKLKFTHKIYYHKFIFLSCVCIYIYILNILIVNIINNKIKNQSIIFKYGYNNFIFSTKRW